MQMLIELTPERVLQFLTNIELASVSALLAYPNPENSVMAPYLEQDRREAVADQIESAILRASSLSPFSLFYGV